MKLNSGVLILGKKEKEALRIVAEHCYQDTTYEGEGSFYSEAILDKKGERVGDKKEIEKAKLGIEVINFLLRSSNA